MYICGVGRAGRFRARYRRPPPMAAARTPAHSLLTRRSQRRPRKSRGMT